MGVIQPLQTPDQRQPSLEALNPDSSPPVIEQYAYRAFDRHWVIADSRVGDRMRPELWRAHGNEQTYITQPINKGTGPRSGGDGNSSNP